MQQPLSLLPLGLLPLFLLAAVVQVQPEEFRAPPHIPGYPRYCRDSSACPLDHVCNKSGPGMSVTADGAGATLYMCAPSHKLVSFGRCACMMRVRDVERPGNVECLSNVECDYPVEVDIEEDALTFLFCRNTTKQGPEDYLNECGPAAAGSGRDGGGEGRRGSPSYIPGFSYSYRRFHGR